jgi:adenosylcobinamide-GDP ribazoletransferase
MKSLLAAIQFFTRLPIWRLCQIDGDAFRHVVEWWPVVGYLTGGTMALVLWGASMVFPPFVAVLLAIIWRLLLTGALHEDGLADVCDGFGGGTDRERILSIMKDSHVGSYGIIGLVLYFLLLAGCMVSIGVADAWRVVLAADVTGKCFASFIIELPYARRASEAKIGVTYVRTPRWRQMLTTLACLLPIVWILPSGTPGWVFVAPAATTFAGLLFLRRKLHGYTGDCCGALFLLCELSFYLVYLAFEY